MSGWLDRLRDDSGATLVEFALVVPVVLLLIVGCLDFGRAANAYLVVANASREAARYASTYPTPITEAQIRVYLAGRVAPLDPSVIGITPTYSAPDPRWTADAPAPSTVTVRITYTWTSSTWLVGSFFTAASGSAHFDVSSAMETVQ